MRSVLRKARFIIPLLGSALVIYFFKIVNRRKKRLFIYTDSRGFEISRWFNRKAPWYSYIMYFIKSFYADVYICPEKHTTIFDFIDKYERARGSYHCVIAHIGVVDFSPRPFDQLKEIYNLKKDKIVRCFGEAFYNNLLAQEPYKELYEGKATGSIIPISLIQEIAVKFNKIENLIWISCNPIDLNWRGNYPKNRPLNINVVNEVYSKSLLLLLREELVVNLTGWNFEDVHKYTCDNIHLSKEGMRFIENKIRLIYEKNY